MLNENTLSTKKKSLVDEASQIRPLQQNGGNKIVRRRQRQQRQEWQQLYASMGHKIPSLTLRGGETRSVCARLRGGVGFAIVAIKKRFATAAIAATATTPGDVLT